MATTKVGRLTSPVVRALEDAWHAIQRHEDNVPEVAIVVASRNRKPVYGHYARTTWLMANGSKATKPKPEDFRAEVLIAAESLNRGGRAVFETLLHEACHGINHVCGIRDTDASGRYHNRRFQATAEACGLVCEHDDRIGCITPDITDDCAKRYKAAIGKLDAALKLYRVEGMGKGKGPDRNYVKLGCDCGRLVRVSRKTNEEGPIVCGLCGSDFIDPDEA